MALSTFSKFYFGHQVTEDNRFINFDEGDGELVAELTQGFYSATEYAQEVQRALNVAGDNAYAVTLNRSVPNLIIDVNNPTDFLFGTGQQIGQSAAPLMGFINQDLLGQTQIVGPNVCGSVFRPQFILQSYVDPDSSEGLIDPAVQRSSEGLIEVVRFGVENFVEFNLRYITNNEMDDVVIKNNPQGLQDAQQFMKYLITKGRFEFMVDINDSNEFLTLILERSPEDQNGTRYKLKEQVSRNLPGIYETGILICRVINRGT
jgi:hypothetical protein